MSIQHLNDSNFNTEIANSRQPVLVDFWAEWCGPCKMIAPILDEVAKEYEGKVKVAKLNVEEGQSIASKFGVMSIPTLMLFKNGQVIKQVVGAVSKSQLREILDNNI